MSKQIAFTADDLGRDEATNLAIESAHRGGALTHASLMLGQPGSAHAVEIAGRNPALCIGWHFHVNDSKPLTRTAWPWGQSPVLAGLAFALWPSARALVRHEIRAQWEQFGTTGLSCACINGHHHLHIHPFVAREMGRLVNPGFNGWVRGFGVRFFSSNWFAGLGQRLLSGPARHWLSVWSPTRQSDSLWGVDRLFTMDAGEVAMAVAALSDGLHEFIFHPRRVGDADHTALIGLRKLAIQQGLADARSRSSD